MTPRARRLARFGLTEAAYERLLKRQHGRCAICRALPKTRRLHVDHDHSYEKGNPNCVRGLLCHGCNRFRVAGNSLESARRVVAYLLAYEQRRSQP